MVLLKKLLFIILLLLSFRAEAQQVLPIDKLLHLGAGYTIGSTTTSIVYYYTRNKKKAILIGTASVVLIGIGKEVYDLKHGDPDLGDLAADIVGGGIGIFTVTINF